jgi:polyisoprenoid-binding protein YceI
MCTTPRAPARTGPPELETPRMRFTPSLVLLALAAMPAAAQAPRPVAAPAATAATAAASSDAFVLDVSHTNVGFRVKHLGINTVNGRFDRFSGSFTWDSTAPALTSVDVTIDAASVDTDIERRDNHLRSSDFFFVDSFPTITFRSTNVRRVEGNRFRVLGDLTIRGVTKPVVLDAELTGLLRLKSGAEVAAVSAKTTINRFDYGLAWNRLTEGVANVAPEVEIVLDIEARKAAPAATSAP